MRRVDLHGLATQIKMANTGIKVIVTMMTTTRVTVAVKEKERNITTYSSITKEDKNQRGWGGLLNHNM